MWADFALLESLFLLCACPRESLLCASGELHRREQTRAKHLPSVAALSESVFVCVCVQHHTSGITSCSRAVSTTARIYGLSTHHATAITLSYVATSFPALHTSNEILQQCRGLCFTELLSDCCKACSLCGQGYARTEGAEQACNCLHR